MNTPRKFLFDTTFETARAAAAPRRVAAKSVRTYTEEELNKAREDGLAAGKQAGQRAAEESLERQVAQTFAALAQRIGDLGRTQAEAFESRGREAIEAALTVVRKLFPHLAQAHGMAEIEAVIADCLARLRDEPRIVIRIADPLLDAINQRLKSLAEKAGFEGKIVLIAQEDLQIGDVRIEWADGGAERDGAALWREIDAIIERVMGMPRPAELMAAAGATALGAARAEDAHELDRPKAASQ